MCHSGYLLEYNNVLQDAVVKNSGAFMSYTFVRNLVRAQLGDSVQFYDGWRSAYGVQQSELGEPWL